MRVLLLTYRFPAHVATADRRTIHELSKFLTQRGHQVHLVAFAASHREAGATGLIEPHVEQSHVIVRSRTASVLSTIRGLASREPLQMWYYRSPRMQRLVERVVTEERIDVVYAYHLRMAQYLTGLPIPTFAALQPAQILHFGRRAEILRNGPVRIVYDLERRRLRGYERAMARRVDRALIISRKDLHAIDPDGTLDNVMLNPHGVDVDAFRPGPEHERESNVLVFSGMMGIDTNADAITHFHSEVYPLIKRRVPDVRLWIVGKDPSASVRRLARDPSVTVTGFVPDVAWYLRKATVAVNPLRIGAGLQNKLLEAMAAGLPVVATEVANEGVGAPADAVCVVDGKREFAEQVVRLLGDPGARNRLGAAGRAYVQKHWSWEAHFEPLLAEMTALSAARVRTDRRAAPQAMPS